MRALRVVVIIGVILGALFAGADRWAVGYAENRLAERIQQARPGQVGGAEVEIHGFPFLTQALSHDLDQVDLRLKDVEATADGRKTRLSQVDASFRGVKLNGSYSGGDRRAGGGDRAPHVRGPHRGLAERRDPDLRRCAGQGEGDRHGGRARQEGHAQRGVDRHARGRPGAKGANGEKVVRVRADQVPGEGIPGIEGMIRKKTDFDRRLDEGLPSGLQLSALTSDESGVHLTLAGKDVSLAGS
ncbi:DUF2993 domain-containing protein [Streptomyces goshikiensis]